MGNRSRECCQLLRCLAVKLLYSLFTRRFMLEFEAKRRFTSSRLKHLFSNLAKMMHCSTTKERISKQNKEQTQLSNEKTIEAPISIQEDATKGVTAIPAFRRKAPEHSEEVRCSEYQRLEPPAVTDSIVPSSPWI